MEVIAGTGKTLVARALANECSVGEKRVAFFMRKGADCLSKWVGESERQLRLLFDQVRFVNQQLLWCHVNEQRCVFCFRLTRCDPPSSSSMRSTASHRSDRVVRIRSTALSCQLSSRSWMALIVVARSSSSEPPTGAYFCG